MQSVTRRRSLALLPLALLAGYVLVGCHSEEPKPTSPGYYTGPLKGKGGATGATTDDPSAAKDK